MALRLLPVLRAGALLSALGAAACGSGASSTATPHPSSRPGGTTPTAPAPFSTTSTTSTTTHTTGNANGTYSVTVSLTGSDPAQGSFTQPVDPGASSHCQPPNQLSGAAGGQHLQAQFVGTASGAPQALSPGDLLLTVGNHTWGVASASNAPHGTTGTVQRNTDGSGSAQFQNLALQTNFAQQPQESGSITWTCA